MSTRLEQQLSLLIELDQLKGVLRKTRIKSVENRLENSAEHSWHVALMALLLEEHANQAVDIGRVVKMLLLHDIVEIDAGDTLVYDQEAIKAKADEELAAAHRLFAILPKEQGESLLQLWLEFERAESADAQFAKALDRLIPMLLNYHNGGIGWQENGVTKRQALLVNQKIELGSTVLWEKALTVIEDAATKGWLK